MAIIKEKDPSLKSYLMQHGLIALGYSPGIADNWWGQKSSAAYNAFLASMNGAHRCIASTFANETDLAAFRRCKATGKTDGECFKVGDNGIGYWGADTTGDNPIVALPPEDIIDKWESVNSGRGRIVLVTYEGTSVRCSLQDLMPHRANIKNGAGIDLNPGAVKALGITNGGMVEVEWIWA